MSLTILPQNPRLPDEPMMTLIAGQPNAAATVRDARSWPIK